MKELKINIKELRVRNDLKPAELAEALGISLTELEQIESGSVPTDSKILDMLRMQYPKLNLHWFMDVAEDNKTRSVKEVVSSAKASLTSNKDPKMASLVREGKHEQVAIQFARRINTAAWPSLQRVRSSDLFIYQFDGRYYLVVASNELEPVAKEHVGKCLWMTPDSLLSLFLPESEMKKSIMFIASTFRKNCHAYGSVMVPDLYPEATAYNRFLESVVADRQRLINSVLESLTYEQILSTMDHISYEEIVYEGETYRIFDVTL